MNDNPFHINMRQDTFIKDGVYSIRTADLGDQYYAIRTQPEDADFAPGTRLVFKVEPVRTYHEAIMYRRQNWELINTDDYSNMYALKAFAFAGDGGINVWKRYRNEGIRELVQEAWDALQAAENHFERRLRAIRRLRSLGVNIHSMTASAEDLRAIALPSKMLWERHAEILWAFGRAHTQEYDATTQIIHVEECGYGAYRPKFLGQ